ncbi:MAG: hypothetical protein CVV49_07115 [Spirochaetae bacterium HGW-Spirochaetae-5]|nr:MAG: hypothetical protein CVV49_07115 [Spirochaetae bacterium HGW-Spirochaetae-5]
MMAKIKTTVIVLSVFLILLYCMACNKGKDHQKNDSAIVTFLIGECFVIDEKGERKLNNGDLVFSKNTIKTKDKSELILQIDKVGIIRLMSNSEFVLDALNNKENGTIIQSKFGTSFSRIIKNDNTKFVINTPTVVASVRGTEFLAENNTEKTSILVRDGVVNLKSIKGTSEVDLVKGKRGDESGDEFTVSNLSKLESLQLKKLAVREYIENINDDEAAEKEKAFQIEENKIEIEIQDEITRWNNLSGLQKLRELGKSLTELSLLDGSKIVGCIISQNAESIMLDTGNGVIKIPKNDIIRRNIVK